MRAASCSRKRHEVNGPRQPTEAGVLVRPAHPMKVKTADLSGRRLDAAVALACRTAPVSAQPETRAKWRPSTNWSQGQPIIDREKIFFKKSADGAAEPWYAWMLAKSGAEGGWTLRESYGADPLI